MYKRSPPSLQCKQILPKHKQIHGHIYAPVINSLITHSIHDLRIFNSLKIHIFHNFVSHSCIIGFLATCRQRNELIKQCGHINLKRRDCKCVAIYTSSAHGVTLAFAWSVYELRGIGELGDKSLWLHHLWVMSLKLHAHVTGALCVPTSQASSGHKTSWPGMRHDCCCGCRQPHVS